MMPCDVCAEMLSPCMMNASCVQEDWPVPPGKGPVGGTQAIGES